MSDNPVDLIRSTLDGFEIAPDLKTLSKIQDLGAHIERTREEKIDDSRNILKALSRKLEISSQVTEALKQATESPEHAEEILQKDREKFQLAKQLNDTETEIMNLESQLQRMKEQILQLQKEEEKEEDFHHYEDDAALLRLRFYHSLGFDLQSFDDMEQRKVIVYTKNDLRTVQISNKYTPFFYSNYLWDLMNDDEGND
ncbi:spindle pole body protein Spc24 [Schizosaccharomyces octosporus yFS286]|uniref:Kinetochore protein Spc24 n=1 Tax=Schizosaccharomyces octosporus (strain yFS286) TaxID=483514 RepID=S9QXK6_SCHOY|nr:spindle pole body protein Spc24 [Schizosaccharomyces octosporus yFS286]EPX71020.1 spindle pole body protein Spc24 [Schizosaccharomyces octosporus yFS286]